MSALDDLAGRLQLHPGATPAITGTRPDAARLAVGKPAAQLPVLLPALFTLCSHAHRFTAQRALDAAHGRLAPAAEDDVRQLRVATARDQVLRIAFDWPRQFGPNGREADATAALRSCPLWRTEWHEAERIAQLPDWLARHWLGMSASAWLDRLAADPSGWAAGWAQAAPGPVAALLHDLRPLAEAARASGPAWQPLADAAALPDTMARLAGRLARREPPVDAAVQPDSGPWTRQADPLRHAADNAWMRMTSRLADLLRLAVPDGSHWLSHGALPLGGGQGIAWTEMARGLLVHWVALDEARTHVADLRVLAPTDLNFHPQGVLAQALSALARDGTARATRVLAVAFDPCVAFDIEGRSAEHPEPAHA